MKLCTYDNNLVGAVTDGKVVAVGEALVRNSFVKEGCTMVDVIDRLSSSPEAMRCVQDALKTAPSKRLAEVKLGAPLYRPSAIWAAAANYNAPFLHSEDKDPNHPYAQRAAAARAAGQAPANRTPRAQLSHEEIMSEFFLKPPASIIGPGDTIVCPNPNAWIDVEMELGVVIGKKAKNVSEAEAMDHVFGYTICWDISQREPKGSREIRKGFDTYTPLGPWIVTRDEIKDPQNLGLKTWRNGDVSMDASTKLMICTVREHIRYLSHVLTLQPGDIITTGTPPGSSRLVDGTKLKGWIEGIGEMELQFEQLKTAPA